VPESAKHQTCTVAGLTASGSRELRIVTGSRVGSIPPEGILMAGTALLCSVTSSRSMSAIGDDSNSC
jgi:hypothetical protein